MTNPTLDPYVAKATNDDLTPQEKIDGVKKIIQEAKFGMLTTHSSDGHLYSRAMTPASPHDRNELTLTFIANNVSPKFDEVKNDSNVNVSFALSNTDWASFSGQAKVSQDPNLIKKYWSSVDKSWFGDLKDGIHKGDETDPRVSVIQVIPDEIRYWTVTKNAAARAVDIATSAVTGNAASPGELRTITKAEIQLTQGLTSK
ncbi:hypothetical protein EV122DRAFT_262326 [Schizophyllum commune]|uniref:uncharacterized protein n=1 Tax=Schizophyllum commune (strain H4-8 / FGSC 9210) TaxID=578458 RepID=UPI00215F68A1|nr:uncharacterized protein SCHCODRAFT_02632111 [Schizophyllum commune H4-8]KAI4521867.1 hypothetical protein K525DRAFT_361920 [Schizophyllum commune Loenen D]KAI5828912.1 hypothetical protein K523DRAFT_320986 [Schizophyllum commune Tattone D]KAI5890527.1 hypothetical protein SCHCODRAFT_02632111 [Schizophyllum commune H4-8]